MAGSLPFAAARSIAVPARRLPSGRCSQDRVSPSGRAGWAVARSGQRTLGCLRPCRSGQRWWADLGTCWLMRGDECGQAAGQPCRMTAPSRQHRQARPHRNRLHRYTPVRGNTRTPGNGVASQRIRTTGAQETFPLTSVRRGVLSHILKLLRVADVAIGRGCLAELSERCLASRR